MLTDLRKMLTVKQLLRDPRDLFIENNTFHNLKYFFTVSKFKFKVMQKLKLSLETKLNICVIHVLAHQKTRIVLVYIEFF